MPKIVRKRIFKKKNLFLADTYSKLTLLFLGTATMLLIISAFLFGKNWIFQANTVIDSPKTEMKEIPKEIQEQDSQFKFLSSYHVPVLIYHYVENVTDQKDTIRQSLNINPYLFEQQVKTLADAGYTFMTAKDLAEVLDEKKEMPIKPVLLTFDDGHWDIVTDVLPILKKYQAKATVYVISGFIGNSDFMNKKQIEEVLGSGLIEIGSHTINHVTLKDLSLATLEKEIYDSKKMMEQTFKIKIFSFAYPNGIFDEKVIETVKKAGYKSAVSTIPGTKVNQNNRYFIFRLHPGNKTGQALLNYLQQKNF